MRIKSVSNFRNPALAGKFFEQWVGEISRMNNTIYRRLDIPTALGNTVVWSINADKKDLKAIIIFPGYRTCGLFWDIDNALAPFKKDYRIFLVDTNGQPCLSDGCTPFIKSDDYGIWAVGLLEGLGVSRAVIMGASFGALVCLKLCLVAPRLVDKVILLNPGCLQLFSLSFKNLYYNFLPLVRPTRRNVEKFLDKVIFFNEHHQVSADAKNLMIDYELFAIREFRDRAEKPYPLPKSDLEDIVSPVYLIVGDKDILFPFKRSIRIAENHIRTLRGVHIVPDTGHGIETSKKAMEVIHQLIITDPDPE